MTTGTALQRKTYSGSKIARSSYQRKEIETLAVVSAANFYKHEDIPSDLVGIGDLIEVVGPDYHAFLEVLGDAGGSWATKVVASSGAGAGAAAPVDNTGDDITIASPSAGPALVLTGTAPAFIRTQTNNLGDERGGFLARIRTPNADPGHAAAFSVSVNGVQTWYEIDENILFPEMFGAAGDRVGANGSFNAAATDDSAALKATDAFSILSRRAWYFNRYRHFVTEPQAFVGLNIITPTFSGEAGQGASSITIKKDTTEDWVKIIENLVSGSVVNIEDAANLVAGSIIDLDKPIKIRCGTVHGAKIQAHWRIRNSADVIFEKLHLVPPTGNRVALIQNALVIMDTCKFDLDDGAGGAIVPIVNGTGIVAKVEHGNLLLQSDFGNSIYDFAGYTGENSILAIDYGSYLWQSASGSSRTHNLTYGGTKAAIVITGSHYYAANTRMEGSMKAGGQNLISLQRNSDCRLDCYTLRGGVQCGLFNASNGVVASNGSDLVGNVSFGELTDGVDLTGGGKGFNQGPNTTYTNVDTEVRSDTLYTLRT